MREHRGSPGLSPTASRPAQPALEPSSPRCRTRTDTEAKVVDPPNWNVGTRSGSARNSAVPARTRRPNSPLQRTRPALDTSSQGRLGNSGELPTASAGAPTDAPPPRIPNEERAAMAHEPTQPMATRAQSLSRPSRGRLPTRDGSDGWAMVDLALQWLPYGGPRSDDIFVQFGITPAVFARRLLAFIRSLEARTFLSPAERDGLHEIAAVFEHRHRQPLNPPPRNPVRPIPAVTPLRVRVD
ncbi:hypothetical protein E143388_08262 [Rhodococcus opacus]|nr:hypothetical protein E143388_08262 [Rhodococcus opacus]